MMEFLARSFWGKAIAAALVAGGASAGIAGATAVVRTYTLDTRIEMVEASVINLDERQRADHDALTTLQADVRYTRQAVTKLLDADGIEHPTEE